MRKNTFYLIIFNVNSNDASSVHRSHTPDNISTCSAQGSRISWRSSLGLITDSTDTKWVIDIASANENSTNTILANVCFLVSETVFVIISSESSIINVIAIQPIANSLFCFSCKIGHVDCVPRLTSTAANNISSWMDKRFIITARVHWKLLFIKSK